MVVEDHQNHHLLLQQQGNNAMSEIFAALCETFRLLLFGALRDLCKVAALGSYCLGALAAASLSAVALRSFFLASAARCRSAFASSAMIS
jgi:hypothetical protein